MAFRYRFPACIRFFRYELARYPGESAARALSCACHERLALGQDLDPFRQIGPQAPEREQGRMADAGQQVRGSDGAKPADKGAGKAK